MTRSVEKAQQRQRGQQWPGRACGPCIIIPIELCQQKKTLLSHTMQSERWQTCNKNTMTPLGKGAQPNLMLLKKKKKDCSLYFEKSLLKWGLSNKCSTLNVINKSVFGLFDSKLPVSGGFGGVCYLDTKLNHHQTNIKSKTRVEHTPRTANSWKSLDGAVPNTARPATDPDPHRKHHSDTPAAKTGQRQIKSTHQP